MPRADTVCFNLDKANDFIEEARRLAGRMEDVIEERGDQISALDHENSSLKDRVLELEKEVVRLQAQVERLALERDELEEQEQLRARSGEKE